ncbi:hypothetical protein EI71_00706 [Anaeroplasma bactoclasticum]|uniref:Uncharacterized protein n=1 Tax=Anaeroplasma bactoclasticum TaxID=2088 RepID=A0A397RUQ6_9MOLU|nr:hypothetical protein [Anaeroplasma bactoclasticum]RIA77923.1 hypothetical protein EI71_00706 [Anaeroplasma bactoclasticum]
MFIMSCYTNLTKQNIIDSIKNPNSRFSMIFFYENGDPDAILMLKDYGREINNISDSINIFTIYDKYFVDSWGKTKGKNHLLAQSDCLDTSEESFCLMHRIANAFSISRIEYPALLIYDSEENQYTYKSFKKEPVTGIYNGIKKIIDILNKDYSEAFTKIRDLIGSFKVQSFTEEQVRNAIDGKAFIDLYEEYKKSSDAVKPIENLCDFAEINRSTLKRRIDSLNLTREDIIILSIFLKIDSFKCSTLLLLKGYLILNKEEPFDATIIDALNKHLDVDTYNENYKGYYQLIFSKRGNQ